MRSLAAALPALNTVGLDRGRHVDPQCVPGCARAGTVRSSAVRDPGVRRCGRWAARRRAGAAAPAPAPVAAMAGFVGDIDELRNQQDRAAGRFHPARRDRAGARPGEADARSVSTRKPQAGCPGYFAVILEIGHPRRLGRDRHSVDDGGDQLGRDGRPRLAI